MKGMGTSTGRGEVSRGSRPLPNPLPFSLLPRACFRDTNLRRESLPVFGARISAVV